MAHRNKASACRDGNGFKVFVPKAGGRGMHELYVHDDGRVDGLPGEADEDAVLVYVAEAEIRAEGWPSVGAAALKRHGFI